VTATGLLITSSGEGEKEPAKQQTIDCEYYFFSHLWLFKQLEDRLCSLYVHTHISYVIAYSIYPLEFISKLPFGNS
jgi:hypothetical protein